MQPRNSQKYMIWKILIMKKIHKQQQTNIESYFVLINYLLK